MSAPSRSFRRAAQQAWLAPKPPARRPNQVDDEEEAEGGPVVEDVAEADEGEEASDETADDAADDAADEGGDAEDVLGEDPSGEPGSADSAAPTPPGSTYLPGSWTTPVLVKVVSYASAEGAAAADLEAARAYAGAGRRNPPPRTNPQRPHQPSLRPHARGRATDVGHGGGEDAVLRSIKSGFC